MPSSYTGNPVNGHRSPVVVMPYVSDGEAASSANLSIDSKLLADFIAWLQAHSAVTDDNNTFSGSNTFNGSTSAAAITASGALSVGGQATVDAVGANAGTIASTLRFGTASSGEGIGSRRTAGSGQWGLDLYTNSAPRVTIRQDGLVDLHGNRISNLASPTPGSADAATASYAEAVAAAVVKSSGNVSAAGILLAQQGAVSASATRISGGQYYVTVPGMTAIGVVCVTPLKSPGGDQLCSPVVYLEAGGFYVSTYTHDPAQTSLPWGRSDFAFSFIVIKL